MRYAIPELRKSAEGREVIVRALEETYREIARIEAQIAQYDREQREAGINEWWDNKR